MSTAKESFPEREERILAFWNREKIFEKSLDKRKNAPLYSFYDGPPFATGLPHYGHLLAGTLKDVIPRYKTMKGYLVPRRFGWDCHGLPVENEIEKEKKLTGTKAIEDFGIAQFNEECSKIVLRYTSEWKKTVLRMGRWVDMENTYRTMDLDFMESVWWVFQQLYNKGMIYEGYKVMPFSCCLGTPLSNFEANLNYKEVDDPSLIVAFAASEPDTYYLAWTTTPWTLVSNLALTVGEDIDYVKIQEKDSQRFYILSRDRVGSVIKGEYEVISHFKGKELKGRSYRPLFPYFASLKEKKAFQIITDPFVSLEEGTGIVHTAPAFGEIDFFACKKNGIDAMACPVDMNGKFTNEVPDYAGIWVKEADKAIIRRLKEEGKLFSQSTIHHRYPFCWRSDTPLIYRAVNSWFVAVEPLRERLLQANAKIHWVPEHIKEGRFGKWLENARDWAISRSRYWGTPLPIWKSQEGDILIVGSIAELEKKCGQKISNLHRQYIDQLTIHHNGKVYKRVPEVFDCWFESGAMPYAQYHYPFENKAQMEKAFPADFIAEGLDQTRGWFYTLTVLAVALFDQPAFKNVVVNGIILAEDGNKMSKRLKNYPEPETIIHRYGADAIRLYMMQSPAVKAEDLRFSTSSVELVMRQVLIPFWNAFSFLSTYAAIYQWEPTLITSPLAAIDRWILSLSQKLIGDVESALEAYDLSKATEPLFGFVDDLTNWYIRRSRSRFWADEDTKDRREAFATLYSALITFCRVAAPFIPFITEAVFKELKKDELSVHLTDFPSYEEKKRDLLLEEEMSLVKRAVSIGHSLRKEHKIKVRQPLSLAHVVASDLNVLASLKNQQQLIAEELNVKELVFHSDEKKFLSLRVKPNFRVLGKKVGKLLPQVQQVLEKLSLPQIKALQRQEPLVVQVGGENISLSHEDIVIEREIKESMAAASDDQIALALEIHLTEELKEEGLAREIVNKINTMRRDLDFLVTDRIHVVMDTSGLVKKCYEKYKNYIQNEVLALSVDFTSTSGEEWDLNGERAIVSIRKASEKGLAP